MKESELLVRQEKQTVFYKMVGDKLKKQRASLLYTQEDLAFIFGISRVSINNIENGKQRLPLHLLKAMGDFLFIPLSELVPEYNYGLKSRQELKEFKVQHAIDKIGL